MPWLGKCNNRVMSVPQLESGGRTPQPHTKEELLLAPERGDQGLPHLVLRTQLQQPLSLCRSREKIPP